MAHQRSIFRLTRAALAGVLAAGLLLSGCAAGAATEPAASTPTPTPTADPKKITADLVATFPTEAEWLENYKGGTLCVAVTAGPTSCGGDEAPIPGATSSGVTLREGVTAVTAGAVILGVDEWDSAEAAQATVDSSKADDLVFSGDFDVPWDQETKAAGVRGTGTMVDFERSGWSGYRMSQVSVNTDGDGAVRSAETSTTSVQMSNGPLSFTLRVYYAEPGAAEAEVNTWLDRVFGPEETD
jgi:hypothetical protein